MDDTIFFGALIYLLLSIGISGFLPDNFYSGSTPKLNDDIEIGINNPSDDTESFSFISKIARMFFAPFIINGIPTIIGLLIFIINIFTTVIAIIYVYDKIRGI